MVSCSSHGNTCQIFDNTPPGCRQGICNIIVVERGQSHGYRIGRLYYFAALVIVWSLVNLIIPRWYCTELDHPRTHLKWIFIQHSDLLFDFVIIKKGHFDLVVVFQINRAVRKRVLSLSIWSMARRLKPLSQGVKQEARLFDWWIGAWRIYLDRML